MGSGGSSSSRQGTGQDRVLSAAYELFLRRGVRAVGVDEIIAAADVAKATFYRHFSSKEELIVSFLKLRGELWTRGWLEAEVVKREVAPRRRLLAIFDVLDEWFQGKSFEGCPFIGMVAQSVEPADRARLEAVAQLAAIRSFVRHLAAEAGLGDPDGFAHSWHVLMAGSIVMALSGDHKAARRAKRAGRLLLSSTQAA